MSANQIALDIWDRLVINILEKNIGCTAWRENIDSSVSFSGQVAWSFLKKLKSLCYFYSVDVTNQLLLFILGTCVHYTSPGDGILLHSDTSTGAQGVCINATNISWSVKTMETYELTTMSAL